MPSKCTLVVVTILKLCLAGCGANSPVPAQQVVVPTKPAPLPAKINPIEKYRRMATLLAEDVERGAPMADFNRDYERLNAEYDRLRFEGKLAPAQMHKVEVVRVNITLAQELLRVSWEIAAMKGSLPANAELKKTADGIRLEIAELK